MSLEIPRVEDKILHTRAGASSDGLLVKFATVPTDEQLAELATGKIAGFEPLFPSTPGKEELEKQFGLDRWYVANVAEDADIDVAARTLAESNKVSLVEYDIKMKLATDGLTFPYEGPVTAPATRAAMSDLGFNDPLIAEQWNYYNLGDLSIASSAYAGADINIKDTWKTLTAGEIKASTPNSIKRSFQ